LGDPDCFYEDRGEKSAGHDLELSNEMSIHHSPSSDLSWFP
jgi:hypothetical protein